MSHSFTDLDVLQAEVEAFRGRLGRTLGTLEELEAVNARFGRLAELVSTYESQTAGWPDLEASARASSEACYRALAELDAKWGALRDELLTSQARAATVLREELFASVDNTRAEFISTVLAHRSSVEKQVSGLRADLEASATDASERIDAVQAGTVERTGHLEIELRDHAGAVTQSLDRIAATLTRQEAALGVLDARLRSTRLVLIAGLVLATALSVLLSRWLA